MFSDDELEQQDSRIWRKHRALINLAITGAQTFPQTFPKLSSKLSSEESWGNMWNMHLLYTNFPPTFPQTFLQTFRQVSTKFQELLKQLNVLLLPLCTKVYCLAGMVATTPILLFICQSSHETDPACLKKSSIPLFEASALLNNRQNHELST